MKAEININGVMSVFPETELEAFALNSWCTQSFTRSGRLKPRKLMIVVNIPGKTPPMFVHQSPQVPGTSAVTGIVMVPENLA